MKEKKHKTQTFKTKHVLCRYIMWDTLINGFERFWHHFLLQNNTIKNTLSDYSTLGWTYNEVQLTWSNQSWNFLLINNESTGNDILFHQACCLVKYHSIALYFPSNVPNNKIIEHFILLIKSNKYVNVVSMIPMLVHH